MPPVLFPHRSIVRTLHLVPFVADPPTSFHRPGLNLAVSPDAPALVLALRVSMDIVSSS